MSNLYKKSVLQQQYIFVSIVAITGYCVSLFLTDYFYNPSTCSSTTRSELTSFVEVLSAGAAMSTLIGSAFRYFLQKMLRGDASYPLAAYVSVNVLLFIGSFVRILAAIGWGWSEICVDSK